jgi:uncharacterized protein (TIGR02246 family)
MSEEKILGVVRELSEAYVSKNVEKMLSFFAEDAVWVTAMGTFRGKEDVRRYFAWDVKVTPGEAQGDGSWNCGEGKQGFL